MGWMKKNMEALQAEYQALVQSLGQTGYISRGSVYEREEGKSGSRHQWTWKNAQQKTQSVALSQEQYQWLKEAVERERKLEKTLKKMRQIATRIVLEHIPGPSRRKKLSLKTLNLI
jgi:hypothetical protein